MESAAELGRVYMGSENVVVAVAIAAGTLYCFLGYRTLKFVIGLTGFVMAGATAAVLAAWASQSDPAATIIIGALGGVCGAMALLFVYRFGVFLLGFMGAWLVAHVALGGRAEPWVVWALLTAAFVGGCLALVVERAAMTIATAAIGAWIVVCGVAFFALGPRFIDLFREPIEYGRNHGTLVACWAVLTLAGAFAQFATSTGRKREIVVREA